MNRINWKTFAVGCMLTTCTVNAFAQEISPIMADEVAPQYVVTQGENYKGYIYVLAHYPATQSNKEHEESAYCYLYINFGNLYAEFDCIVIRPNELRGCHIGGTSPAAEWYRTMTKYAMGFYKGCDHVTIVFGENEYRKNINY